MRQMPETSEGHEWASETESPKRTSTEWTALLLFRRHHSEPCNVFRCWFTPQNIQRRQNVQELNTLVWPHSVTSVWKTHSAADTCIHQFLLPVWIWQDGSVDDQLWFFTEEREHSSSARWHELNVSRSKVPEVLILSLVVSDLTWSLNCETVAADLYWQESGGTSSNLASVRNVRVALPSGVIWAGRRLLLWKHHCGKVPAFTGLVWSNVQLRQTALRQHLSVFELLDHQ